MGEVEKLINRILEDARSQAEANIGRAKSEAESIIEAAKRNAEIKSREIIEKAEKESVEIKRRMIAAAELEARKERLKAKQEVIDSAFKKALEKLCSMPDDQYQAMLVDMIVDCSESGKEEVILSEKDKKRMSSGFIDEINKRVRKKGLDAGIRLSEKSVPMKGGFILNSGEYELNHSFEAIINMIREELEMEVAGLLF